ncbi:hypothetical protein L211DRAFT_665711 [Terfezia boudieri ATCC MYA-4762]|uniref:Protein N-terminal and lysine N-methyltransferase EFM7 n=1 Tax=Terfezia boudieri ATCC MYA-4762 TaxID=1051890 RepID=A0A3N4LC94_9PEZI|nr:hypothetical protein L211DRAFT_665711 [Terfezia boudieri ATCC MYA-4762]
MIDTEAEYHLDLFEDPPSYRPTTPPPTFSTHTLLSGPTLTLRLVGHDPLWGHHLWNSGRVLAHYLERHASSLVTGKDVLELGAGSGLPGIVCGAVGGARRVNPQVQVVTDYPSAALISNIQYNIDHTPLLDQHRVFARGYLWGRDPTPLLPEIIEAEICDPPTTHHSQTTNPTNINTNTNVFSLLILSDLLFNHSEHHSLINTILLTLSKSDPAACAVVFFTPHRPWLYEKDMAFFELAREEGLAVDKVLEEVLPEPMFEIDRGDRELRRRVFGYKLRWGERQAEMSVVGKRDS